MDNRSLRGPEESVIRYMTKVSLNAGSVNLAQGFPDSSPPFELRAGIALATLGGTNEGIERLLKVPIAELVGSEVGISGLTIEELLRRVDPSLPKKDIFNQYSIPAGTPELRMAISKKAREFNGIDSDPDRNIVVTCGATEAIYSTLSAIVGPNGRNEVIVFQPFHEMYPNQLHLVGGVGKYVTINEPDWNSPNPQWQFDREELKKMFSEKTVAIILNTPHNPTGLVFSEDDLRFIADLCIKYNAFAVTDEIYEHLTYDGHHHISIASLDGMQDRTLTCNAISKTYLATGLRLGWIIGPEEVIKRAKAVHDTIVIQAPTIVQKGYEMVLNSKGLALEGDYYKKLADGYRQRRDVLLRGLQEVGFRCANPQGAYYLFADFSGIRPDLDPMRFAMLLTERAKVTPVPGDNFYEKGSALGTSYVRFAFARQIGTLEQAVRQLKSTDLR